MLKWIDESNKYEEVQTAYFDSYEITVIRFSAGGSCAWMKKSDIASSPFFKKSYPNGMTIEETKEQFLSELREYLQEQASYWTDIISSLRAAES